jgi:hypothetical protein
MNPRADVCLVTNRPGRLDAGLVLNRPLEDVVGERQHSAVDVVNQDDFAGLHQPPALRMTCASPSLMPSTR